MSHPAFSAVLGSSQNRGLLPFEQRLQTLNRGDNPYQSKTALVANSPVFVGRARELHAFHQALAASNSASISIEGEPRIGKSSLLNQVVAQLQQYDNLITICCNAQSMGKTDQRHFFSGVAASILNCLAAVSANNNTDNLPKNYRDFRNIIKKYAPRYRFVLVLDEFEVLADNPVFGRIFFDNLRNLGDVPDNNFSLLVASHNSLESLCQQGYIKGSRFYNIFDVHILGLLDKNSTQQLIKNPLDFLNICIYADILDKVYIQHPYYLQMELAEIITAQQLGINYDYRRIRHNMLATMQELWSRRTKEEVEYLFKAIAKQPLPDNDRCYVLESRGLLIREDNKVHLFSNLFKYALPDEFLPSGCSREQYLNIIKQDPHKAFRILYTKMGWDRVKDNIKEVAELYQPFKSNN